MNYNSCTVFTAKVVKIILQVIGICLICFNHLEKYFP